MTITPEQLHEKLNRGEHLYLLDVREEYEFEEGTINAAEVQHIPLHNIPASKEKLGPLKDEEVVVFCENGNRSKQAELLLKQMGLTNVFNLEGGISAWNELKEG